MRSVWLLLGAIFGYVLMMRTNPVAESLRDGLRALRRYSSLWTILAVCAFGYAAFDLAVRYSFFRVMPEELRPAFQWFREGKLDELKLEHLWKLPLQELKPAALSSFLPALESTAGIFDNLVSTFPIAAIGALLLLFNWQGHQGVLFRALRRRFAWRGVVAHFCILLCALAALLKPAMFAMPWYVDGGLWYRWAPVLEWLAFIFEYLFGTLIQVYLILLAYCWVRGLTFSTQHLRDFAIRRFSLVMRWAIVVVALSSVLINLPLILKNFDVIARWLGQNPDELEQWIVDSWIIIARGILAAILILFATMQITLTFHSESLRRAVGDHFRFVARHWWTLGWFLIIALVHFFLLHFLNALLLLGFGEGTALWVLWKLLFPLLAAFVGAWLLASWVIVYRRAGAAQAGKTEWIEF
jgi:hypothetical protein